ncbi:hypothetical protein WR25_16705 [Diploscapter pachys]|uniref:Tyrosine-protein kinase n=1 Tax=Diploscapter pachys TaxID=2018661 RepID=A0A2A2LU35_9BILA|nr:hypothetical protein WR25_16705 [Diploscapter pachys]
MNVDSLQSMIPLTQKSSSRLGRSPPPDKPTALLEPASHLPTARTLTWEFRNVNAAVIDCTQKTLNGEANMPVGVPNEYNPVTGETNDFSQPANKATVTTAALQVEPVEQSNSSQQKSLKAADEKNPVRLDVFTNSASSALSTLEHAQPKQEGLAHSKDAARLHTVKKNFINLKRVTSYNGANGAALEDEPYYHGYMAREETERLVQKNGEFLVRKTETAVVTVLYNGKPQHLQIHETHNRLVWLNDYCFSNVPDLIRFHIKTQKPVYRQGTKLGVWVNREQWELYHEQVNVTTKLGNGEFGEVFKGTLTLGPFTKPVEVAIKTLKGRGMSADDRVTFLREANVMLKLTHKNVIKLYGVATQKEPIMIVMELASEGSLISRLRATPKKGLDTKRKYCKQIANGMAYLEKQQA